MHAKYANRTTLNEQSKIVFGSANTVLNTLGAGFLENIYENALALELHRAGLAVAQQHGATVTYDGTVVGDYFIDLLSRVRFWSN